MQWQNVSSCRTCLLEGNKAEVVEVIPKFEEENWEDGVQQSLQEFLGVEFQNHKLMPSRVCAKCVETLEAALRFRRLCLASQAKLLETAAKKIEFIEIPEETLYEELEITAGQLSEELVDFSDRNECDEDLIPPIPTNKKSKKSKLKSDNDEQIKLESPEPEEQKPKKVKDVKGRRSGGAPDCAVAQSGAPVQIMCEICGNIYNKRSLLNLHMRRHLQLKNFKCELCGKAFVAKMEMHRHIRVHTGARPFKCKYCPRAFGDVSTVKKHERVHTKERPFVCQTCGKDFAYSHVLKDHLLTHTGEKRFSCHPCNKTFARIHLLKQHMGTLTHKQTASTTGEL